MRKKCPKNNRGERGAERGGESDGERERERGGERDVISWEQETNFSLF
jgi:hypothetical protein